MTSVYIGPYVRCTVTTKQEMVMVRTCTNQRCVNHQTDQVLYTAFCPNCGSPVGNVGHMEETETVDIWELTALINERLCKPGENEYALWAKENRSHIWIPNVSYGIDRNAHLHDFGFDVTNIAAANLSDELIRFTVAFQDEMAVLREAYGANNIYIYWGIIQGD